MRKHTFVAFCLTLLVAAAPARAVNMQWLRYSPVRFYTEQDWQHYQTAVDKALNQSRDGETVTWRNPQTGAAGEVTVLKTYRKGHRQCRRLRLSHRLRGLKGETYHWFCRQENGDWRVTEAGQRDNAPSP